MAELLETGLVLMAAGMGTVFVLLAALVFMVHGVSRLSRWLAPPVPVAAAPPPATTPKNEAELVTVIGAAVAAYQRDNGQR
jgi:oxaloacetate decarboxylase gamma subunit